jgi:hypothetical protein
MTTERFTAQARRNVEARFLTAGDDLRATLAYEMMLDINMAEESIRSAAQRLRDRADDADRDLDNGSQLSHLSIGHLAEDANQAIARRQAAFKVLARLMSQEEIAAAMKEGQA